MKYDIFTFFSCPLMKAWTTGLEFGDNFCSPIYDPTEVMISITYIDMFHVFSPG